MNALAACLCLLFGAYAWAETPADFAFGMALETSGSAALWQLELPAAVYQRVRSADLGDLRVFNAAGEAVPHAFLPRPADEKERRAPLRLPFFALRGDAATGVDGLQIHVERQRGRAVVNVREGEGAARASVLLGYLVDASVPDEALRAFRLEPARGGEDLIGRLRVEASDDLGQWRLVRREAPVVQLVAGGQRLEQLRVDFPAERAKYFRLTWAPGSARIELAGLLAEPAAGVVEPQRRWHEVAASALEEGQGQYVADLGGQFPVDRLRLTLPQANSVAAVQILSRASESDPWRQVAARSVYRLGPPGEEIVSPDLAIAPTTHRHWLVRVDPRGGGLGAGKLRFAAGWLPQRLVFAARGPGPFQLAFGSARAANSAYPVATLVPGYRHDDSGLVGELPIAEAGVGDVVTLAGDGALRPAIDWKRWLLWSSLLLGVAVLGWMALRLAREVSPARGDGSPEKAEDR
ncbi:DUF3999 domain-containing protein [Accumulibacter sp.]|uniref:DUF3999 domain-containing protein n=1 Tax=Accumulibacter sp. TaxID=2053492 RepID=UPI0025DD6CD2|nr:DUF3999 domain-containing protein [Accumulibacter sp.]MCM8625632.1 DUF3999 domain-containing protein [Accumulibacter sp.]